MCEPKYFLRTQSFRFSGCCRRHHLQSIFQTWHETNENTDATSIDTGNDDRDKHLKGKDFFDIEKHLQITFVSKKSVLAGKGKFKLEGDDLTMHGVTKPVTLDVEGPSAQINDKHGNVKVGAMISDDVVINLEIELSQPDPAKKDRLRLACLTESLNDFLIRAETTMTL